jgi:tetratricopeptide (TPR) repeat protein
MESTEGHLVLDAQRLHELFGVSTNAWQSVVGLEVDHRAFGLGKIQEIREGGPSNLRVEITFSIGTKTLSSANLGKESLLVVRSGKNVAPQILSELMTREGLIEHKRQTAIEREKAAELERQRADEERLAAEELVLKLEKQKREEAIRLESARRERTRREEEEAASRREFEELRHSYDIRDLKDERPTNPLFGVLLKRRAGEQLRKQDIDIVRKQGQYRFAADWHREQFRQSGKPGFLAALGSDLRNCGKSREAVGLIRREIQDKGIKNASVFTNFGAALADEGELQDAEMWALKALQLEVSFYPHNLLGRVYFRNGDPQRGEDHFNLALQFGAEPAKLQSTMENAMEETEVAQRTLNAAYLLKLDPIKYGWAKQFI